MTLRKEKVLRCHCFDSIKCTSSSCETVARELVESFSGWCSGCTQMTTCETRLRSMVVVEVVSVSRYGQMDGLLVVVHSNASLLLNANQQ